MNFTDALKFWLAQALVGVGIVLALAVLLAVGFLIYGLWTHWREK